MLPLHLPCLSSPLQLLRLLLPLLLRSLFHSCPSPMPRDSLCPSPSGTLIMRPANGPARRLAVSVGGVCVVGVDAGSCVEVEKRERERDGGKV